MIGSATHPLEGSCQEAIHPPYTTCASFFRCVLLSALHPRCAGDGPRALSVSVSTVRLGQDRLSGVRASEAILGGERHPRPQIISCQQKIWDFHTRFKVM
jgi:hypothetical protein